MLKRPLFQGLLVIMAFFFVASSSFAETYDFRKVRWGMSVEEVKEAETAPLIEKYSSEFMLRYQCEVGEIPLELVYKFESKKLVDAVYLYTGGDVLTEKDMLVFKTIHDALSLQNGPPNFYEKRWEEKSFPPSSKGTSLRQYYRYTINKPRHDSLALGAIEYAGWTEGERVIQMYLQARPPHVQTIVHFIQRPKE